MSVIRSTADLPQLSEAPPIRQCFDVGFLCNADIAARRSLACLTALTLMTLSLHVSMLDATQSDPSLFRPDLSSQRIKSPWEGRATLARARDTQRRERGCIKNGGHREGLKFEVSCFGARYDEIGLLLNDRSKRGTSVD